MALLTLHDVTVGFGGQPLLEGVSAGFDSDERVALVGRNGVGKSTFLRVLVGELPPDSGEIQRTPNLRVALLSQSVPFDMQGSVFEMVASGLGSLGEAVAAQHRFSRHPPGNEAEEQEFSRSQETLHHADGWTAIRGVETVVSRLSLDPDSDVASLSAGVRRRVLLGRALVQEPDILLLDEPTNHLDIDSIQWLEGFLTAFRGALLFVTHDRVFLESVASRILDLERGRLTSYSCSWKKYLERKQEALEAEAEKDLLFDKKLAEEEVWIRKGVKERRKRNMGRVRELQKMRAERRSRRARLGSARMIAQEAERTGRLVIDALDVSFSYGDRTIVKGFTATVQRGDRVGILGPNGVGKTTLLRLLLQELAPDTGRVRHGTNLQVAYFDQLHSTLDEQKMVRDNVADGAETIRIGGRPRHVVGYLQDFLFPPIQARSLVSTLSGGERNRLLLARLFAQPTNVLVFDEPTNDLDVETLDLLEELLLEYSGTVLVVSHDRAFLDNVVTSTIAFDGNSVVKEYVGGYSDWQRQRQDSAAGSPSRKAVKTNKGQPSPQDRPRRLTYLEKRELEELPSRIESLEEERKEILDAMGQPEFYSKSRAVIDEATQRLTALKVELDSAYGRWEELEEHSG